MIDHIAKKGRIRGLGARPSIRDISSLIEDKIIDLIINDDTGCTDVIAILRESEIEIRLKNTVKT